MAEKHQITGLDVARAVKYQLHLCTPNAMYLPLQNVQAKTFYVKHQKVFDNAAMIFSKYGVDELQYAKFFVKEAGKSAWDIDKSFLTSQTFNEFVQHLKIIDEKCKIYRRFLKTAEFIASECHRLGFPSLKDWLRHVIAEGKLANYYVAGKISKHFLAAIPNLPKFVDKLDQFSKAELSTIVDRFDKYSTDVNEAFLFIKKCKPNPVDIVDTLIAQKTEDEYNIPC